MTGLPPVEAHVSLPDGMVSADTLRYMAAVLEHYAAGAVLLPTYCTECGHDPTEVDTDDVHGMIDGHPVVGCSAGIWLVDPTCVGIASPNCSAATVEPPAPRWKPAQRGQYVNRGPGWHQVITDVSGWHGRSRQDGRGAGQIRTWWELESHAAGQRVPTLTYHPSLVAAALAAVGARSHVADLDIAWRETTWGGRP
jgi:hypothetical protein